MSIEKKCIEICDDVIDCSVCVDDECEKVCSELEDKCLSICVETLGEQLF
jgi:hypothetical protein